MIKKSGIFLVFCFRLAVVFAQHNLPLGNELNNAYAEHLDKLDVNFHTSFKPYLATELNRTRPYSVYTDTCHYWSLKPQWKSFAGDSVISRHSFDVLPLFRASYSSDFFNDTAYTGLGAGAALNYAFSDQFAANVAFYTDHSPFPSYLKPYTDSFRVVPGMGIAHPASRGYSYTTFSGYASWSPHPYFNFQGGVGKHFIGDGYRSLLLSDHAYNYPYFRFTVNFWRVKYAVIYSMMQDISGSGGNSDLFRRKYSTMHYLSWNISRRVSLGIFESVIWQAKDSLLNRQFDPNYLNPFVFYRPVEYAQGSADNVLLGLNLKVNISDHYLVYGQLILDEFLLREVKADSGWWANKYGFQFGAKAFTPLGIRNLHLQTEYNIVRPFTYTHRSVTQNYGHFNEALAHPLGANFKEWVSFARYTYKRFQVEEKFIWSQYGADRDSVSYGGNVFLSYASRVGDYHNFIAQGNRNILFYNELKLSYVLMPSWNLRLWLSHVYRKSENEQGVSDMHLLGVGISSLLWNQYTDR